MSTKSVEHFPSVLFVTCRDIPSYANTEGALSLSSNPITNFFLVSSLGGAGAARSARYKNRESWVAKICKVSLFVLDEKSGEVNSILRR